MPAQPIESFPTQIRAPRGVCGAESRICGVGSIGCGRFFDDPTEIDLDRVPRRQVTPPPEFTRGDQLGGRTSGLPAVYSTAGPQPLLGEVLRKAPVWMLVESQAGGEAVEHGDLQLYANGLRFQREESSWGQENPTLDVLLVPFSFVRPVAMQSAALMESMSPVPFSKILSVTLYLEGRTHFFCFGGWEEHEAQGCCMQWVNDISRGIRWVTESLFINGSCFQTASPTAEDDSNRLMAGYLLHSDPGEKVRMLYVELQPPREGKARVTLYDDFACSGEIDKEAVIDARTPSYEKVGAECSCFCVGSLQLSARTVFERQLWLRAVQNLKVKLQSRGPDPRAEELNSWREAINEHIRENAGKLKNKTHINDHKGTSAVVSNSEFLEGEAAAVSRSAEKLKGTPLLKRCVPQLDRPGGDTELPRPESQASTEKGTEGLPKKHPGDRQIPREL